jgi:SAM-dependent methyltransferase
MCAPGCAAEAGWQETDCEEVVMGSATVQGQLWGTGADDWAEVIEPMLRPVHLAVLAALAPLSGLSLLDAGCGAGLALRLAAEQGARVSGLDASAALLDVARGRLPDADLRVGDIEELQYDDATFDVVTAYNSIQYASDPKTAVAELARVARPGGRVAIEVGGDQVEQRPSGHGRRAGQVPYLAHCAGIGAEGGQADGDVGNVAVGVGQVGVADEVGAPPG